MISQERWLMLKDSIIAILNSHIKEIKKFKVKSLSIFGSIARGEDRPESDVDILVGFDGPASFDSYMELKFYLEEICDRKVDLISDKALKPILRKHIERDLIRVA